LQKSFAQEDSIVNEVLPLITTRWNQNRFYNTYCPWDVRAGLGNDYRVYNGCVALAAAQLMNYYRHPEVGKGTAIYQPYNYPLQTVTFSRHNYHWDAMCNSATAYTNEIAKLTYHLGVACKMNYGPDGSGAYTEDVAAAMQNYFFYTGYKQWMGNDPYTMKNELELGQPILMSGSNGTSGHAFLVDGYYETYVDAGIDDVEFHFNWGWGGYADGYFTLKNHDFAYGSMIFFDIKPATNYPVQCQQNKRQTAFQGYVTNGSINKPYQSNPDCSWMIAAPGATQYNFSFSRMDTKEDVDIITIYNGSAKSSGVAATLSGTKIPTQFISVSADSVLITFTSNDPTVENTTQRGFLMNYVANKPQQQCNSITILNAPSGYITNGTMPGENYTPWTSCTWNIAPNNNTGFFGLFHEFDVELGDFVDIFDATRTPPRFWRRFDKHTPPIVGEMLSIPFSNIQLQFITDNFAEGAGFKFQYYSLLSINDNSLLDNLTIYPNPASDVINIAFSSEWTNQTIVCRLIDVAGKEVYATLFNYTDNLFAAQIPVAHLSKGLYVLQLTTTAGIVTSKIIID